MTSAALTKVSLFPRKQRSKSAKRLFNTAAYVAAAIGGIIAGHELTAPKNVQPKHVVGDVHAMSDWGLNPRSHFLSAAGRLKIMAEWRDQQGIDDSLDELASIYKAIIDRSPSPSMASNFGQVAQSDFVRGFTGGTMAGSPELDMYYQEVLRRVKS